MKEIEKNLDGTDLRVGVVLSRFNSDIGDGLLSACTAELLKLG
ncbi:MAG TPA: 6,7-dimethyl-8-ribityllumazine synthase, partial [Methylotenera sp.]|nr:6,7-dimethyl-8-ribityllumazine synthase [Methylotenera sp.]